jgi:hypothetical protein
VFSNRLLRILDHSLGPLFLRWIGTTRGSHFSVLVVAATAVDYSGNGFGSL